MKLIWNLELVSEFHFRSNRDGTYLLLIIKQLGSLVSQFHYFRINTILVEQDAQGLCYFEQSMQTGSRYGFVGDFLKLESFRKALPVDMLL